MKKTYRTNFELGYTIMIVTGYVLLFYIISLVFYFLGVEATRVIQLSLVIVMIPSLALSLVLWYVGTREDVIDGINARALEKTIYKGVNSYKRKELIDTLKTTVKLLPFVLCFVYLTIYLIVDWALGVVDTKAIVIILFYISTLIIFVSAIKDILKLIEILISKS